MEDAMLAVYLKRAIGTCSGIFVSLRKSTPLFAFILQNHMKTHMMSNQAGMQGNVIIFVKWQ